MPATQKKHPLRDFRNFLYHIWKFLNLPDPTPCQYDIAEYLQHGPRRLGIEAFRGVGKSWITAAFVCWCLLWNPQMKILVVSASKERADNFSTFALRLINEVPILQHLKPGHDQRCSKVSFDVAPAEPAQSPSVKSVGIFGQLTGSRADLIVADDVESLNNSATAGMRVKLQEGIKEFDSILKPEAHARIVFLGTPQSQMSIYSVLPDRGYRIQIWPARYPNETEMLFYGGMLSPRLARLLTDDPSLEGTPTDPTRFNEMELMERELSYGRTGFALQFMLNTSLSDMNRFPLKQRDLVVMNLDPENGPEKVVWGASPDLVCKDLPNVGFNGDYLYRPMTTVGDYLPYTGSVLVIDPSGRGSDETTYAVVKMLNTQLFLMDIGGMPGGYDDGTLQGLADKAKQHQVNQVLVESNFGDGMFTALLEPYLSKTHPVSTEEVRHSIQKERRIIDTLEPVMNQHKLIINEKIVEEDYHSVDHLPPEVGPQYRLFYQMTRLTADRGSLAHDDRVDVLAMAVAYWVEQMNTDTEKQQEAHKAKLLDQELRDFVKAAGGKVAKGRVWHSLRR